MHINFYLDRLIAVWWWVCEPFASSNCISLSDNVENKILIVLIWYDGKGRKDSFFWFLRKDKKNYKGYFFTKFVGITITVSCISQFLSNCM